MLAAMGLRAWFRRHGNVFSISTREVDVGPGNEDMLVEEYGERAVEARRQAPRPLLAPQRGVGFAGAMTPQLDVSQDEIQEAEPPPDSAS